MKPIIVSYATLYPTFYAVAREQQIARCEELGLQHSIRLVEPAGDWYANCRFKPVFLQRCLKDKVWFAKGTPPDAPLCWLDVDARLNRADSLPESGWDIGRHRATGGCEFTCGLICLNRTEGALLFLDAWIERMEREGTAGEHGPLVRTYNEPPEGVRVIDVTDFFDWDVNEYMRGPCGRPGPLSCPQCGKQYDELVGGRQMICRQCRTEMFL